MADGRPGRGKLRFPANAHLRSKLDEQVQQFNEVLLGEASETADLPDGFRFHWMSLIPVWKATLAGLSETEQAEVMRRACSEDQPVTEGYTPYGTIQDAAGREWRRLGCAQSRASHDLAG